MSFKLTSSQDMLKKTQKGEYIEILLRSSKTIFSMEDIALLWREEVGSAARTRLSHYVKIGKLVRPYRGFYAKDNNYNRLELATRIYTPAYISFETVLTQSGINFQYYGNIFVASCVKREITVDRQNISIVKIKDHVLSNTSGIEHKNNIAIASPERAFLDRVYVSKDYHFDYLDILNWDKVFEILPIYGNNRLNKKIKTYFNNFQEERP